MRRVSAQTRFITSGIEACSDGAADAVIEATGNPAAGIAHALAAIEARKPVIMVNVEADVLAGPLLAKKARENGVVYSMAYGDQPALIAEMVDWARAAGFEVIAAGKGTKFLPAYHHVTPAEVWSHYGLTAEEAKRAGMNPQMFNSFLDGTKSALEMAAVANACDLDRAGRWAFLSALRRRSPGRRCCARARPADSSPREGMVEVVSSLERDGRPVFRDLRWGVYVVFKAPNDYAASCFKQYGLVTDQSGRYAAMYKPFHLIGLELSISVLHAVLNKPADRCDARLARRRGGRRQARSQGRRDARRRRRLHRLWQAYPRRPQLEGSCAADRTRPQCQAQATGAQRPHRRLRRRGARP